MKYFSAFTFTFVTLFSLGQNNVPTIEITDIEVDETAEIVTLYYSLDDGDNDACEVWLKMSVDGGTYFEMINFDNLSGDAGENIYSGDNLSLSWNYTGLTEGIGS